MIGLPTQKKNSRKIERLSFFKMFVSYFSENEERSDAGLGKQNSIDVFRMSAESKRPRGHTTQECKIILS